MGLIKSMIGAVSSTLHDEWKEAIRCEDMQDDVLMMKKTTSTGVISNGSIIIVAPGQCAVIYDNGKILDATAEEGTFVFDTSSTPSFFAGQFKESFKEMWQRFTFDGGTAKEQYVFYFNMKEIKNNKFGTATPIPFQDWSHPIPNRMTNSISPLSVNVRCYGTYTFKIINPAMFMQEISGTADEYSKINILDQIKSEVMSSFQNVLNELGTSNHKIPVLELPSQTDEIKEAMDKNIFDEAIRKRGIQLLSFSVESVSLDEESKKKINEYELGSNQYMQQGKMANAYSNAMENAASNVNGAENGFLGVGMMNMATGGAVNAQANGVWKNSGDDNNSKTIDPYAQDEEKSNQVDNSTSEENNNIEDITNDENSNEVSENITENDETIKNIEEKASEGKPETKIMCIKCGSMNSSEAKFCNNCGYQIKH